MLSVKAAANYLLGGNIDRAFKALNNRYSSVSSFDSIPIYSGLYNVSYVGVDASSPLPTVSNPFWWTVIVINDGNNNRVTQIASQVFSVNKRGHIYLREKHDDTWTSWFDFIGGGPAMYQTLQAITFTGGYGAYKTDIRSTDVDRTQYPNVIVNSVGSNEAFVASVINGSHDVYEISIRCVSNASLNGAITLMITYIG